MPNPVALFALPLWFAGTAISMLVLSEVRLGKVRRGRPRVLQARLTPPGGRSRPGCLTQDGDGWLLWLPRTLGTAPVRIATDSVSRTWWASSYQNPNFQIRRYSVSGDGRLVIGARNHRTLMAMLEVPGPPAGTRYRSLGQMPWRLLWLGGLFFMLAASLATIHEVFGSIGAWPLVLVAALGTWLVALARWRRVVRSVPTTEVLPERVWVPPPERPPPANAWQANAERRAEETGWVTMLDPPELRRLAHIGGQALFNGTVLFVAGAGLVLAWLHDADVWEHGPILTEPAVVIQAGRDLPVRNSLVRLPHGQTLKLQTWRLLEVDETLPVAHVGELARLQGDPGPAIELGTRLAILLIGGLFAAAGLLRFRGRSAPADCATEEVGYAAFRCDDDVLLVLLDAEGFPTASAAVTSTIPPYGLVRVPEHRDGFAWWRPRVDGRPVPQVGPASAMDADALEKRLKSVRVTRFG